MRSVIPIAAASATAAFIATAFTIEPTPAAAQQVCGGTPIEVSVQVWERQHADKLAQAVWSNCARRYYGEEWGWIRAAQEKTRVRCYYAGTSRNYYRNNGIISCHGSEIAYPNWVCYYRALPCRYRPNSDEDE